MKRIKKLSMVVTQTVMNEKELQTFNRWLYDMIVYCVNCNEQVMVDLTNNRDIKKGTQ